MGLKPNPGEWGHSFGAFTLLLGSFDPYKSVPDMTYRYNVFGGTLSLTQASTWMTNCNFEDLLCIHHKQMEQVNCVTVVKGHV